MLLMIDNYDSFTYNLVQYFGELGADVKVLRNDEVGVADIERLDPERMKSLVDRALRRLGEEVERHGGTIDQYIGDNVTGARNVSACSA